MTAAILNTDHRDNLNFLKLGLIVAGSVTSTGTVNSGSGFTSSRSSTGVYVVTFNTAFSSPPGIGVQLYNIVFVLGGSFISAWSASSFTVSVRDSSNAAQDAMFLFVAGLT